MAKKLKFPALNSIVAKPLFKAPVQGSEEGEEAFKKRVEAFEQVEGVSLRIRLVGHAKSNEFMMRAKRLRHEEKVRRHALGLSPEAEKDEPDSAESAKAWGALTVDLCRELVVGVDGVIIGEKESEAISDVEELIQFLDLAGWRDHAALLALNAQSPDVESVLS